MHMLSVGGLLGALDTTPWYYAITFGLGLIVVSAVMLWLMNYNDTGVSPNGCLGILLGFLGLVFALVGFTALAMGLFWGE